MKAAVIVFPGSNCDRDIQVSLRKSMGTEPLMVWHQNSSFDNVDLITIPGGFSYGDYLRCGSMASKSKVMNEVVKHANNGGYVFGICNGFQILTETGLLPGALLRNSKLKFICKNVHLKPISNNAAITKGLDHSAAYSVPIAHGEGRYYAADETISELEQNDQILFKYCDSNGLDSMEHNPNGSLLNIAGVTNTAKNVFGMMPHPERSSDPILNNSDGAKLFESLLKYC